MKMLMKHVSLIVFIVFLKSKVWSNETPVKECEGEVIAVQHLVSYYGWLYRFTRYWYPYLYAKTLVCSMNELQRRKVCAQVAKYCYFKEKPQVTVKEIFDETTAGEECKKHDFEYRREDGSGYKTSKKKMFLCPLVSKWGQQMSNVYISASNEINSVLVFQKKKDNIRLVHKVKNLDFETNDESKKKLLPVTTTGAKVITVKKSEIPQELMSPEAKKLITGEKPEKPKELMSPEANQS